MSIYSIHAEIYTTYYEMYFIISLILGHSIGQANNFFS